MYAIYVKLKVIERECLSIRSIINVSGCVGKLKTVEIEMCACVFFLFHGIYNDIINFPFVKKILEIIEWLLNRENMLCIFFFVSLFLSSKWFNDVKWKWSFSHESGIEFNAIECKDHLFYCFVLFCCVGWNHKTMLPYKLENHFTFQTGNSI